MSSLEEIKEMVRVVDETLIFIGNPGTGKSTAVNCYTGKKLFKARASIDGSGVTKVLNGAIHQNILYVDTPGLSDMKLRKKAGEAIETAFKLGGRFKIIFVITTEEGRLKPDDLTTISLVTSAINENVEQIKENGFSIMVNKCDPEWLELLQEDENEQVWTENLMDALTGTGVPTTNRVHFARRLPALIAKVDQVIPLGDSFDTFLKTAPVIDVEGQHVGEVHTDTFDEVKERNAELAESLHQAVQAQHQLREEMRRQEENFTSRMDQQKAGFSAELAEHKVAQDRLLGQIQELRQKAQADAKRVADMEKQRKLEESQRIEAEKRELKRGQDQLRRQIEAAEKRAAEAERRAEMEEARRKEEGQQRNMRASAIETQARRLDSYCSSEQTQFFAEYSTFDEVFNYATTLGIPNIGRFNRPFSSSPGYAGMTTFDRSTVSDLRRAMMQRATEVRNGYA